jgi:hypothetical protein
MWWILIVTVVCEWWVTIAVCLFQSASYWILHSASREFKKIMLYCKFSCGDLREDINILLYVKLLLIYYYIIAVVFIHHRRVPQSERWKSKSECPQKNAAPVPLNPTFGKPVEESLLILTFRQKKHEVSKVLIVWKICSNHPAVNAMLNFFVWGVINLLNKNS